MTLMTCSQFRDSLDGYLDRELSPDAMEAADRHRAECPACERLSAQAVALRSAVKRAVMASEASPDLERRIRAAVEGHRPMWRWGIAVAAAVLVLSVIGADAYRSRVEHGTANVMDRVALNLDESSKVVLHGTLLCRDCELEHRYGIEAPCRRIGHHGAIATPDGHIWNLVDQKIASELIHNESLLGRQIEVQGRLFRGARTLVIESYRFES
jgi:putative zinc finger protein